MNEEVPTNAIMMALKGQLPKAKPKKKKKQPVETIPKVVDETPPDTIAPETEDADATLMAIKGKVPKAKEAVVEPKPAPSSPGKTGFHPCDEMGERDGPPVMPDETLSPNTVMVAMKGGALPKAKKKKQVDPWKGKRGLALGMSNSARKPIPETVSDATGEKKSEAPIADLPDGPDDNWNKMARGELGDEGDVKPKQNSIGEDADQPTQKQLERERRKAERKAEREARRNERSKSLAAQETSPSPGVSSEKDDRETREERRARRAAEREQRRAERQSAVRTDELKKAKGPSKPRFGQSTSEQPRMTAAQRRARRKALTDELRELRKREKEILEMLGGLGEESDKHKPTIAPERTPSPEFAGWNSRAKTARAGRRQANKKPVRANTLRVLKKPTHKRARTSGSVIKRRDLPKNMFRDADDDVWDKFWDTTPIEREGPREEVPLTRQERERARTAILDKRKQGTQRKRTGRQKQRLTAPKPGHQRAGSADLSRRKNRAGARAHSAEASPRKRGGRGAGLAASDDAWGKFFTDNPDAIQFEKREEVPLTAEERRRARAAMGHDL